MRALAGYKDIKRGTMGILGRSVFCQTHLVLAILVIYWIYVLVVHSVQPAMSRTAPEMHGVRVRTLVGSLSMVGNINFVFCFVVFYSELTERFLLKIGQDYFTCSHSNRTIVSLPLINRTNLRRDGNLTTPKWNTTRACTRNGVCYIKVKDSQNQVKRRVSVHWDKCNQSECTSLKV